MPAITAQTGARRHAAGPPQQYITNTTRLCITGYGPSTLSLPKVPLPHGTPPASSGCVSASPLWVRAPLHRANVAPPQANTSLRREARDANVALSAREHAALSGGMRRQRRSSAREHAASSGGTRRQRRSSAREHATSSGGTRRQRRSSAGEHAASSGGTRRQRRTSARELAASSGWHATPTSLLRRRTRCSSGGTVRRQPFAGEHAASSGGHATPTSHTPLRWRRQRRSSADNHNASPGGRAPTASLHCRRLHCFVGGQSAHNVHPPQAYPLPRWGAERRQRHSSAGNCAASSGAEHRQRCSSAGVLTASWGGRAPATSLLRRQPRCFVGGQSAGNVAPQQTTALLRRGAEHRKRRSSAGIPTASSGAARRICRLSCRHPLRRPHGQQPG